MKKAIATVLCVAVLVAVLACVFAGCEKDGGAVIKDYQAIPVKTYAIGEEYKSSDVEITANLEDGTTRKIEKNLVFVGEDALPLDDQQCFTAAGEFKIKVYTLQERDDLFVGEWTIKVA